MARREGDDVTPNQPLVEVETAKATVEIPSPYAGAIATLHGGAGDAVAVGAPLVTFRVAGAPDEEAKEAPGALRAPVGSSPAATVDPLRRPGRSRPRRPSGSSRRIWAWTSRRSRAAGRAVA